MRFALRRRRTLLWQVRRRQFYSCERGRYAVRLSVPQMFIPTAAILPILWQVWFEYPAALVNIAKSSSRVYFRNESEFAHAG